MTSVGSWFDREHLAAYLHHAWIANVRFIQAFTTFLCIIVAALLFYYRASIKKRLKIVDEQISRGLVYRDKTSKPQKVVKCIELHPQLVQDHPEWQLCSLGEYINTLRFFTDNDDDNGTSTNTNETQKQTRDQLSKAVERELQVAMGSVLLTSFGPTVGAALLPLLGLNRVETLLGKLVSRFLSWVVAHVFVDFGQEWDPAGDMAAMPFNVGELISFVNLNQKFKQPGRDKEKPVEEQEEKDTEVASSTTTSLPTPLEWMERGEVAYNPTYYTHPDGMPIIEQSLAVKEISTINNCTEGTGTKTVGESAAPPTRKVLIVNPFIVEEHFVAAILGLEDRIRQQETATTKDESTYDPNDTSLPEPTPVNEHILPDLYLGWGDAKCTHTKREILRNRLFATLLTKLSHNYNCRRQNLNQEEYFVVRLGGRNCTFPDEFIQALLDTGHQIEVCPRSTITTFGLAVCIKEEDGSWTNVPIGFFFRSGYERMNRRPVYFATPHGGIDLMIQGPLVGSNETTGQPNKCNIQFYLAIEGMCGWHSNHNADVPWIRPVSTTDVYDKEKALRVIRMSGLLACTFNAIGTEMKLPFGGYGVLGVCNDTAAFVDFAVRGTTNMYPLLSTGRFLMHTAAHLMDLWKKLSAYDDMKLAVGDTRILAAAACRMESDLHCSPVNLIGATRRYLANFPVSYFQIQEDSREEMKNISREYKAFLDGRRLDGGKQLSVSQFVDFLVGNNAIVDESANQVE